MDEHELSALLRELAGVVAPVRARTDACARLMGPACLDGVAVSMLAACMYPGVELD